MKLSNIVKDIYDRLEKHEKRLREDNLNQRFKKFFKRKINWQQQSNAYQGVHLALCVDTRDPLKQNRVKYFSPVLHVPIQYSAKGEAGNPAGGELQTTKISQLDWAYPISAMGGFDDCGLTWVPPPGSTLCIFFLHGEPNFAFYAGTTWYRDKGPIQHDNWNYHIPEYYKIFEGHRAGYMVGKNDESQVFPSWNTDNSQGYDLDGIVDTEFSPDAVTKTTWPHIYGFTTPEKHRFKADDGDPKCNRRYKRLEIVSSMGHLFLMKDDPYHHCGSWNNPQCDISYVDIVPSICLVSVTNYSDVGDNSIQFSVIANPFPCSQGPDFCSIIPSEIPSFTVEQEYTGTEAFCPSRIPYPDVIAPQIPDDCLKGIITGPTDFCFRFNNTGKNKYHKHRQECFPYYCHDCGLVQSGIQIRSRSGHTMVMDDSVEEPREKPEWERTLKPFDMDGCSGNYRGRTYWKSSTGHYIEMVDIEDQPKLRSPRNGINIVTATGNSIILNDYTKPGCFAGETRGIYLTSTSNHKLEMCDNTNKQCSDERTGCSKPGPYAQKAFVRLRSGYGLSVTLADNNDQIKTDQQYIQIMSPQKDNLVRGPHVLHMQEKANGPGQVFLRSGGDYIVYSYDRFVEVVGEEKDNPSDKLEFISHHKIVSVNEVYYNHCGTAVFWADDYIFLLAGRDCDPQSPVGQGQPCIYPVCVATQQIPEFVSAVTGIRASNHVFASALANPEECEGIASVP